MLIIFNICYFILTSVYKSLHSEKVSYFGEKVVFKILFNMVSAFCCFFICFFCCFSHLFCLSPSISNTPPNILKYFFCCIPLCFLPPLLLQMAYGITHHYRSPSQLCPHQNDDIKNYMDSAVETGYAESLEVVTKEKEKLFMEN